MKIDPVLISIAALIVSLVSLAFSLSRAGLDRRLQFEQMRGRVQTKLTTQGIELINMIEQLQLIDSTEAHELSIKLIKIAEGLMNARRTLTEFEKPPRFRTSRLIAGFAPIASSIDNMEPVFEKLRAAIQTTDLSKAARVADGLLVQLLGNEPNKK